MGMINMNNISTTLLVFLGVAMFKVHGIDDGILDSMVAEVVAEESGNNKADATGEELILNREEREAEPGLKKLLKKLFKKSKRNADPEAEAQFQSCDGSQCNQNNLGSPFGAFGGFGPAAQPLGFGFGGFSGAQQNCLGSQCNQNNVFGKRKREIAEAVDKLATDILNEEAKQVAKREADAQFLNCVGSQCNQNNLGINFGAVNNFGPVNNCIGSQCNTNNFFGRRKKEIADAVNQLAEDMLVEEINHVVQKEAEGQRKKREIVASILEEF